MPSPAKCPVNGRATFRPLGSHTRRKPSRACAKEGHLLLALATRRILAPKAKQKVGRGYRPLGGTIRATTPDREKYKYNSLRQSRLVLWRQLHTERSELAHPGPPPHLSLARKPGVTMLHVAPSLFCVRRRRPASVCRRSSTPCPGAGMHGRAFGWRPTAPQASRRSGGWSRRRCRAQRPSRARVPRAPKG